MFVRSLVHALTRPAPVLRNRSFAVLWSGMLVSGLGDWLTYVALVAVVYQQTHSALAVVGLRLLHIVPEIVLGPFAGVFVDRWSRKRTLVLSPLVAGTFIGVLTFAHPLVLAYVAEAVLTITAMVFDPAVSASMPNIVAQDDLVHANSLAQITSTLSILVGGLTGGLLVAGLGASAAFGLDSISYLFIALLITTVHVREEAIVESVASIERELRDGLHYLRHHRLVANLVTAGGLFILGPASMFTLGIVFAQTVLHGGAAGYGILLAGLGAGSFVGAVVAIACHGRLREDITFAISGIASGVAIASLGLSRSMTLATVLYGVSGCMSIITSVSAVTLIQRLVPHNLRGRIFGVASTFDHLAAFGSTLFIAVGAGFLSTSDLITSSGAVAALVGVWVLVVALRLPNETHRGTVSVSALAETAERTPSTSRPEFVTKQVVRRQSLRSFRKRGRRA